MSVWWQQNVVEFWWLWTLMALGFYLAASVCAVAGEFVGPELECVLRQAGLAFAAASCLGAGLLMAAGTTVFLTKVL